jgi:excisionase family DNA binding protein
MFYSLQEAAEKLKIREQDVQELVNEGKLREFIDGANVLFKVNEVDALMSDTRVMAARAPGGEPQVEAGADEIALAPETGGDAGQAAPAEAGTAAEAGATGRKGEPQPADVPELDGTGTVGDFVDTGEGAEAVDTRATGDLIDSGAAVDLAGLGDSAGLGGTGGLGDSMGLADSAGLGGTSGLGDSVGLGDTGGAGEVADAGAAAEVGGTEGPAKQSELAEADTVVGGEGINVLGEADGEFELTDDTKAETKGGTEEAMLEEIEEDVNLDTFGSGSGLLDLSLQADDTSLGSILDEIYTAEGEQETREGSALELGEETGGGSGAVLPEEAEISVAEAIPEIAEVAAVRAGAGPDAVSTWFGIMLILPSLAVIYAIVVSLTSFRGGMPGILAKLEGLGAPYGVHVIWYIMLGFAVASGILAGVPFMGSGTGVKAVKKGKPKKAKKPRVKKEKVKKPKKEKPKKEKKSKRGK